jgi:peptide/nickel transport system ATP-binding protein
VSGPVIALEGISRRFVRRGDLAARLAALIGAGAAREGTVVAVDGIDLAVGEREIVGLVGESGCGKSTLGRIAVDLDPPSAGRVRFRGAALDALDGAARRRAKLALQMIFQDPMASLNPRMRVIDLVGEAPVVHGLVTAAERQDYVDRLLRQVGLDGGHRGRYPHQFSGGQRARIGIARALAVRPAFLVCDEPVAALDVSIQAQVLNLFLDLRDALGLSYLFISHDLGVVEHLSDRVAIMYLGRVVEVAATAELFARPNHPYTRALIADAPRLAPGKRRFAAIAGELPSPYDPPAGCHFHPRCPFAMPRCRAERPALREVAPGHLAACHLNEGS